MTVTITLTIAEADTGNFSIFSNMDLITPLQTGVSRSSLMSGYQVAGVPNAATSLIVKSNSTHCTNDIIIPIQGITTSTTTTTTTTQACVQVRYGYDPNSPYEACKNYYEASSFYYFNGQTLYVGPGCSGALADSGYYSDGTNSYQWDSAQPQNGFYNPDLCDNKRNIQIYTRINVDPSGTPNQSIKIAYSTDQGGNWSFVGGPNQQDYYITTPSYNSFRAIEDSNGDNFPISDVTIGSDLWIIVVPSDWVVGVGGGINFAAATNVNNIGCIGDLPPAPAKQFNSYGTYPYCYSVQTIQNLNPNCSNFTFAENSDEGIYNFGNVTGDAEIFILLNGYASGSQRYRGCSN
jgi:hypothetical protein